MSETQEKHEPEWKTPQYSLLKFFCRSLRFLSFNSSQDSIANGALVRSLGRRLQLRLATGIRPSIGRKAHNDAPRGTEC